MDYTTIIGLGAAGLILTKIAVDTVGGYVFTSKLLGDGLNPREIEQQIGECMPSDMRYASKAGRELAYLFHKRAGRNQGRRNGVGQL